MTQNVASVRQVELEQGWTRLVLEIDELSLTVLPEKGCDLLALVDRRTGVDGLWKTPWEMPPRGAGTWNAESASNVDNLVAALLALHGAGLDGYPLPVARHEDARGLRCALVPAEDEQQRPLILIWNRTDSGLVPVLAQEADPVLREALSTTGDEVGADIRQG
ncbi:MAG: hypothetical protein JJE50_06385 [Actinomycetales bacterium]|nr:hypothetical protein [Actinomycetales bacterium]